MKTDSISSSPVLLFRHEWGEKIRSRVYSSIISPYFKYPKIIQLKTTCEM